MVLVIVILAFIFGMFLVMGLTSPVANDKTLLNSRIDNIARNASDDFDIIPSLPDAEMDATFVERIVRPTLRRISSIATRMTPAAATDEIRALIIKAGNPGRIGVAEFIGIKVITFFVMLGMGLIAVKVVAPDDTLTSAGLLAFCLILGYIAPDVMMQQVINGRQALVRKRLPDTIDLLIVSVEAGLGLDGAISKVVDKMRGPIAEEFSRVLDEMRLGKQRSRAMKDMAARLDIQEVTTFVAAIYQSEQLGVSIASVLRVQSESIRIARTQAIRESAAKLPVLMLIPLIFFIFPSILVVMLGPGIISIRNAFAHLN
jgi:tight adherence protein C